MKNATRLSHFAYLIHSLEIQAVECFESRFVNEWRVFILFPAELNCNRHRCAHKSDPLFLCTTQYVYYYCQYVKRCNRLVTVAKRDTSRSSSPVPSAVRLN